MAAKARCVPLPAYPSILCERKEDLTHEEVDLRFNALVTHYGLTYEFGYGLDGGARLLGGGPRVTKDGWAKLARALLYDFVPAFRIPRRPGRPKLKAEPENYLAFVLAGFSSSDVESYTQALFVKAVLEAKGSKSRETGYQRLAANAKLRNKLLPPRYRTLKTPGSFRQMWKQIPKAIRDDPNGYLRPPSEGSLFGIPKSVLEKMPAGNVASEGSK